MVIQVGNFKLVSNKDAFDLFQNRKVNKLDKQTREQTGEIGEREVVIGYNMRLETCIEKIIKINLSDQDIKIDLPTYINMYKEEREKVMNVLK